MTSPVPPDVADLLLAIHEVLEPSTSRADVIPVVQGVIARVLSGTSCGAAARTLRRHYAALSVCDSCHSEPVVVLDRDRRLCSTCALKVCACCQVRRATVIYGATEICSLCFERQAAEAEATYAP